MQSNTRLFYKNHISTSPDLPRERCRNISYRFSLSLRLSIPGWLLCASGYLTLLFISGPQKSSFYPAPGCFLTFKTFEASALNYTGRDRQCRERSFSSNEFPFSVSLSSAKRRQEKRLRKVFPRSVVSVQIPSQRGYTPLVPAAKER